MPFCKNKKVCVLVPRQLHQRPYSWMDLRTISLLLRPPTPRARTHHPTLPSIPPGCLVYSALFCLSHQLTWLLARLSLRPCLSYALCHFASPLALRHSTHRWSTPAGSFYPPTLLQPPRSSLSPVFMSLLLWMSTLSLLLSLSLSLSLSVRLSVRLSVCLSPSSHVSLVLPCRPSISYLLCPHPFSVLLPCPLRTEARRL